METFLSMLILIMIFVGFFFFVIRPMQKRGGTGAGYTLDKKIGTDFTTCSYPDSLISGVADSSQDDRQP